MPSDQLAVAFRQAACPGTASDDRPRKAIFSASDFGLSTTLRATMRAAASRFSAPQRPISKACALRSTAAPFQRDGLRDRRMAERDQPHLPGGAEGPSCWNRSNRPAGCAPGPTRRKASTFSLKSCLKVRPPNPLPGMREFGVAGEGAGDDLVAVHRSTCLAPGASGPAFFAPPPSPPGRHRSPHAPRPGRRGVAVDVLGPVRQPQMLSRQHRPSAPSPAISIMADALAVDLRRLRHHRAYGHEPVPPTPVDREHMCVCPQLPAGPVSGRFETSHLGVRLLADLGTSSSVTKLGQKPFSS